MAVRPASILALFCVTAPFAAAQTPDSAPTVIEDVNKDVFRALQYARNSKPSGNWGDREVLIVKNGLVKDGVLDTAEKALLKSLDAEAFNLLVRARKDPEFNPKDITLQGPMPASARKALTSTLEADLAAALAPRPGESRAAFLVRKREDGLVELVSLVTTDETARAEARELLAKRFEDAYAQAMAKDPARAFLDLRSAVSNEVNMAVAKLSHQQRPAYGLLLAEAAVLCSRKNFLAIDHFAPFFSGPDAIGPESQAIAKRLGLP